MFRVGFIILVCFAFLSNANHVHEWNYDENGPDVWSEKFPICAGQFQSPINILTACTVYKNFTPFEFQSGFTERHNFTLLNNGHTISVTFNVEQNLKTLRMTGGNLNGTFEMVNFHLHWGQNHKSGSEHEV